MLMSFGTTATSPATISTSDFEDLPSGISFDPTLMFFLNLNNLLIHVDLLLIIPHPRVEDPLRVALGPTDF
ncbi:hypothetical protein PCASD_16720 [Puccinia coronata f. sp. avenae]|uniref:Uncharacterized protein n=1 Tax=Puccinia coronata f. sp. avenae TaxID=200324 RepID=A0A2N5TX86_9BASI|nr:hypothetical protein PCASD_16720 [Puccinia coronata f. sp. avenae]